MAGTTAARAVELDGRTLEGGGQLVRMALCLATMTGQSVTITNIRGNRSGGGGLKAQHLACVKWLAHACCARVEGAEKGSKSLTFEPGKPTYVAPMFQKVTNKASTSSWECELDIGTAGSTGLALQAMLPFLLFLPPSDNAPVRVTLKGGTNVSGSPSFEYITQVLLPTLKSIGFPAITATLGKRGWSHGGSAIGNFTLEIPARPRMSPLPAFYLVSDGGQRKPGQITRVKVTFIAPATCHKVLRGMLPEALGRNFVELDDLGEILTITCEDSHHDKRMYLIIALTATDRSSNRQYRLGRDCLYDRKIRSHEHAAIKMVQQVSKELAEEWKSGAWVDEHMRDQLVIFQALAKGRCKVHSGCDEEGAVRQPSLHARTAEWVARQMLNVRFDSEGVCDGVAFGYATVVECAGSRADDGSRNAGAHDAADMLSEKTRQLSLQ